MQSTKLSVKQPPPVAAKPKIQLPPVLPPKPVAAKRKSVSTITTAKKETAVLNDSSMQYQLDTGTNETVLQIDPLVKKSSSCDPVQKNEALASRDHVKKNLLSSVSDSLVPSPTNEQPVNRETLEPSVTAKRVVDEFVKQHDKEDGTNDGNNDTSDDGKSRELNDNVMMLLYENKETLGINFKTDTTGTSLRSSRDSSSKIITPDSSSRRRPPPPPPKKSPNEAIGTNMKKSIPLSKIIAPDSPPTRRPPPPPPPPPPPTLDLPPRRHPPPPPPPPHLHRHVRSQNPETHIRVEQEKYINLMLPIMRHAHVMDWTRRYQPQPDTETLLHKETKPYTNVDTKREPIEPMDEADEYIDMTEFHTKSSFPHPHAHSLYPPPLPPARKPNKIQRAFSNQDLYIHRETPNSPVMIKHMETLHDEKQSQNLELTEEDEDEEYMDMRSLNVQEPSRFQLSHENDDDYESIDELRHRLPPYVQERKNITSTNKCKDTKSAQSQDTGGDHTHRTTVPSPPPSSNSTIQSFYQDDVIYETIDVLRPIPPPRRERNAQRVVSSSTSNSQHTYTETSLTRPNKLQTFQSLDSPDNNDSSIDMNYVIMQKQ